MPGAPSTTSSTAASTDPSPRRPRIGRAALDYFRTVALGAEYGDSDPVVKKWDKAIVTVHANGPVRPANRDCLDTVIADFNALTTTTDLRLTGDPTADIEMHFAPVSRFASLEPHYVRGNTGFFYDHWEMDGSISGAIVLISTTEVTSTAQCHLIREELTQSMGLMRDSNDYPASIFYGPWTTSTRYAPIDEQLISLLYSGALSAGDDWPTVVAAVTVV
jgi:hypothetical protein